MLIQHERIVSVLPLRLRGLSRDNTVWTSKNKWSLIVDGEFFLFLVANNQATLFLQIAPTVRSTGSIVSFFICGSFKHSVGRENIDEQTNRKHIWTRLSDTIKIGAEPSYGTIFGTVPKIRAQTVQTVES